MHFCFLTKKGQLQIQETILTIFIFIVLIMFGLIFFYRVQSASIQDAFLAFQRDKSSVDFITLGDLPEFSCSEGGIKGNCIDTVKLLTFMSLNGSKKYSSYYFERLGYANITFYQVYPKETTNNILCGGSTLEACGVWNVYLHKPKKIRSKLVRDTPVSLYFPLQRRYVLGMLIVEIYDV